MGLKFISYKEGSRKDWGTDLDVDGGEDINGGQIKLGAILRIADSLEKIEKPYQKLIERNDWLSKRNNRLMEENNRLRNSNTGYKSRVTRLKNKLEDK